MEFLLDGLLYQQGAVTISDCRPDMTRLLCEKMPGFETLESTFCFDLLSDTDDIADQPRLDALHNATATPATDPNQCKASSNAAPIARHPPVTEEKSTNLQSTAPQAAAQVLKLFQPSAVDFLQLQLQNEDDMSQGIAPRQSPNAKAHGLHQLPPKQSLSSHQLDACQSLPQHRTEASISGFKHQRQAGFSRYHLQDQQSIFQDHLHQPHQLAERHCTSHLSEQQAALYPSVYERNPAKGANGEFVANETFLPRDLPSFTFEKCGDHPPRPASEQPQKVSETVSHTILSCQYLNTIWRWAIADSCIPLNHKEISERLRDLYAALTL